MHPPHPTPKPVIVTARNLKKSYGKSQVLKGINLNLSRGEIVSIVGASGAGKTTFLQIMGTLDCPDTGNLLVEGVDPFALKPKARASFRNRHVGFVFQFHNLIPELNSLENVCLPAYIGGQSVRKTEKKAKELLKTLGLSAKAHCFPNRLSGGEAQRVAIARALMNDPLVVYADEPTGNLDSKNAEGLYTLFLTLREEINQSFVIATHNKELSARTDRVLLMKDGLLVETP